MLLQGLGFFFLLTNTPCSGVSVSLPCSPAAFLLRVEHGASTCLVCPKQGQLATPGLPTDLAVARGLCVGLSILLGLGALYFKGLFLAERRRSRRLLCSQPQMRKAGAQ